MNRVPLGAGAYQRLYGQGPEIRMENRFFEESPTNPDGASLLSRPGSTLFDAQGGAPYRAMYAQHGVFDGDLFIASSDGVNGALHRYGSGVPIAVADSDSITDISHDISFAASVGLYYENLFIASDAGLMYYEPTSFARGYVRVGGAGLIDQVVRVGDTYYKWAGPGNPLNGGDGTSGDPYIIAYSDATTGPEADDNNASGMQSLQLAINYETRPGSTTRPYTNTIVARNALVRAEEYSVKDFDIGVSEFEPRTWLPLVARDGGTAGNAVVLGIGSGDIVVGNGTGEITTGSTTLDGGGVHTLKLATVPEDFDVGKVVALSGFVLVIERNSMRFYFIRPGKTEIDALDFESAESEPDKIVDAIKAGDLVWLFGESSMEAWYASGDADHPIQRMAGMSFRIGAVKATAALVKDTVIFVGTDNVVYQINGRPQRISNNGIEERLRKNGVNPPPDPGETPIPDMLAWSYDLDGHAFYVLTLEGEGTFVYDLTTQQWHHWYSASRAPRWNMVRGVKWGARILAIDWEREGVWELDAESMIDEDTDLITRVVTGITPHRDRKRATCSYLSVYASVGHPDDPTPLPSLSIRFSDDNGATWTGPFTKTLTLSMTQELYFQSLGMIGVPGRVWEISDVGGLVRIDSVYAQID